MSKSPNPMVMAAIKKRDTQDPMKLRGRAYGLGERNPQTLPYVFTGPNRSETATENWEASRKWKSLRKQVQAGRFIGAKY
jgi:hypothetical protein